MNNIKLKDTTRLMIDSREVAEMIGKRHCDLLTDIEGRKDGRGVGIIPVLKNGNIPVIDFFIETTYNVEHRIYKNYLITKQGCELICNKQQGEKGILFTAKYVQRFHCMEEEIKQLQEDKAKLCDVVSMKELQLRKYQQDKYNYSIRNIRYIIEQSSFKTLDKNIEKILEVHTNLDLQDRYKYYRNLEKSEYIDRIKELIIERLNQVSARTYLPSKVIAILESNLKLHKDMLKSANKSKRDYVYQLHLRDESIERVKQLALSM